MKSDVLMKAVDETEFGSLKDLPFLKMEHSYVKKLLDNFNVDTCSIFWVQIKDKNVVTILGVSDGTEIITTSIGEENRPKFRGKFGKKSLFLLTSILKNLKSPDLDFKETFCLLVFGNFYCPSIKDEPKDFCSAEL